MRSLKIAEDTTHHRDCVTDNLADYLARMYGTCKLAGRCRCLRTLWVLSQHCPNWQPTPAKTWEELTEWQMEVHNEQLRES